MQHATASGLLTGLFLSAIAWGQGLSTINGGVADPTGAVVPGANITVKEVDTGLTRTTVSNADGLYVLSSLRPAGYTLTVGAPGFRTTTQTGITLQANDVVTINLKLELGSTSESVTVESSAAQIDTSTATLRQVVDSARIVELPLNGRNAAQLTTLVAGAVLGPSNSADQGITKTFPSAVTVSVNGARINQTSYSLDGVPNTELLSNVNLPFPMPDALQEFSVQTSNYSAEYGQNAGGVVSIVTRSGANAFHGDAFGYVRNAQFNARNFFAAQRDPLKRAQYGGTVGGRIVRDKAFFFFGYQGTRVRTETGGLSAYSPTPANLTGDFSALLSATDPNNPQGRAITLKDPLTNQPFPGNLIPSSRLDPASLYMALNWLPPAGRNGLAFYSRPTAQNFGEYTTREDYNISGNDRLAFRYFRDSFSQPGVLVPHILNTYNDYSDITEQNAVISETHVFSPRLLNEFRFGVSRETDRRGPPPTSPSVKTFGVNVWQEPTPGIESISVASYFSFGTFPPGSFPRVAFIWNDVLRYVRGRHSFAFGGSYERARLDEVSQTNTDGTYTFSGDTTGAALGDFMLGALRTFTQGDGTIESNRHNLFSIYAQDSFKVNSQLTLNYGVRWEPSLPWHDRYQTGEIFSPAWYAQGLKSQRFPNAPPGELFAGDHGVPQDGRAADWHNVALRLGFAYDLFGNGKTSIRGGVGEFYDARVPGWNTNKMSQSTPFTLLVSLTTPKGPFSNPYLGITNPFPSPLPPPSNLVFPAPVSVWSFDPNMKIVTPVIYNGNLTIEQQVAPNWLVRAAYVFSRSNHINVDEQVNPAVYIPGSTLSTDARRVYPGYSLISWGAVPGGNSWYNAMQLNLQKRLSRGFTILANYTWSKSLDNIPMRTDLTNLAIGGWYVMPITMPGYEALDHGPSDFDVRHVASISYVWQIPNLSKQNWFVRGATNGWALNGIVSVQSGLPLTVEAGQDRSLTGIGYDRGVLVGQQTYSSGPCANVAPCVNWLNPQAFALPASGTFGNIGKGSLRMPGLWNWDMTMAKSFPIKERVSVQFRADFFNVFNHANFGLGATSNTLTAYTVAGAGFGTIRAARDPRIGQMALKVTF